MPDEPKKQTGWVEWVKEHPAIVGTGLYVYVSFQGSAYNWLFLRAFDINYFDFSEVNDFLTAAFRQPETFLFLGGAILYVVPVLWTLFFRQRRIFSTGSRFLRVMARIMIFGIIPLMVIFMSVFLSSSIDIQRTRTGNGSYVVVKLARGGGTFESPPDAGLMLLGTSDKFIFLWNRVSDKKHIVAGASVASLRLCRGTELLPCKP